MVWISNPVSRLSGRILPPGDKSCSHRALMFAALASGRSVISGLLEGDDVLRTGEACRALGANVKQIAPYTWEVIGTGGYSQPDDRIDFGNSGTGSRLMMGAMAGFPIRVDLTGDESLRSRPMARVLDPLKSMGADVKGEDPDRLPLTLIGSSDLQAIDYTPPHASAQVKSAILLAGLNAKGTTIVREARKTRDHTERMLEGFGIELTQEAVGDGQNISIVGGQSLTPVDFTVPGDPSSAAFLFAAGMISPDADVTIEGIMTNPTRAGLLKLAYDMGELEDLERHTISGEEVVTVRVTGSGRVKRAIPGQELTAAMIDEFPIYAVLAAFAEGETRITGAEELRVKESDRITATVNMLRANGVEADELPDGFVIQGCNGKVPGGGVVETMHDHRIAMSALIMGTASQEPVGVDDIAMIATSYPEFFQHMRTLGADIREA